MCNLETSGLILVWSLCLTIIKECIFKDTCLYKNYKMIQVSSRKLSDCVIYKNFCLSKSCHLHTSKPTSIITHYTERYKVSKCNNFSKHQQNCCHITTAVLWQQQCSCTCTSLSIMTPLHKQVAYIYIQFHLVCTQFVQ